MVDMREEGNGEAHDEAPGEAPDGRAQTRTATSTHGSAVTKGLQKWFGSWNFKQKPTGLFKWVLRIPNGLYRLHLGFLFGNRIILITHRGRHSGDLHQTPVEVLEHDMATREYIVCSGAGVKSDWYQNLLAAPPVGVQVRHKRWIPTMRHLDPDEAAARLLGYERKSPVLAKRLLASMGRSYNGTNTDRRRVVEGMPMIAFSDTARTKNAWAART